MIRRCLLLAFIALLALGAANFPLYLKDGTHHMVREYKIDGDRVTYYSTERGDWEEIPLDLVDLQKTELELKQKAEDRKQDLAAYEAEDKADKQQRKEAEQVPAEAGVYQYADGKLVTLVQAKARTVSDKKRSALRIITPIPIVAGKTSVELDGVKSDYVLQSTLPEFYFRLANDERFGIARVKPEKSSRLVQTWTQVPVTNELADQMETVEVFKRQIATDLYRIWPTKPLSPGEYAVYEYTEGKGNIQIWDFAVSEAAK
jgi:hypothetical protein